MQPLACVSAGRQAITYSASVHRPTSYSLARQQFRGQKSVAAGRQAKECSGGPTNYIYSASAVPRPKECSGASRATRLLT
ncbi:hypothetical protein GW17_00049649, partial [Ensete ventricosum]